MKRAILLLLLALPLHGQDSVPPPVAVTYTMDATQAKSGAVKVEMLVENNRDDEVTLGIPVWEPGRYRVISFHLGIKDLEADVSGKKTEVKGTDHKSLWKLKTGGAPKFKVRYTLKPDEVPQLRGQLSEDHYDLLGPSAWLYVKDRMNGPHRVTFRMPTNWKVGTGLKRISQNTFGERDYDTFIDCPVELGKFNLHKFEHEGVNYELVVHAPEEYAAAKLVDVHKKFVAEQTRMFGGAPFERYVFLYHFTPGYGGDGLEHLNSTRINYPMRAVKQDPAYIASIASHEFFHLWNVKRIRPKELGPFDYTQPVRTKALWLCEGGTSYYGDLTLARTGVWSRDQYLRHLAGEMTQLQTNPARKTQSVEQASWTIWDRAYGSRSSTAIDYYNKGELLCWLLDMKIRQATEGRKSFDDVMRHLYGSLVVEPGKAGKGPIGVGFEENGILKAVNEVSGRDFAEFFAKHVSGVEELPYDEVCALLGLTLSRQRYLGIRLMDQKVTADPPEGTEFHKAGIKKGDELLRVNDTPVGQGVDLLKVLAPFNFGQVVTLLFTREGAKAPFHVNVPIVEGTHALAVSAASTEEQKALLKTWLSPAK